MRTLEIIDIECAYVLLGLGENVVEESVGHGGTGQGTYVLVTLL